MVSKGGFSIAMLINYQRVSSMPHSRCSEPQLQDCQIVLATTLLIYLLFTSPSLRGLTTSNNLWYTCCQADDTSSMTLKGYKRTHANTNKPTHTDPYAASYTMLTYILIYSNTFRIYMHIMQTHTLEASLIRILGKHHRDIWSHS